MKEIYSTWFLFCSSFRAWSWETELRPWNRVCLKHGMVSLFSCCGITELPSCNKASAVSCDPSQMLCPWGLAELGWHWETGLCHLILGKWNVNVINQGSIHSQRTDWNGPFMAYFFCLLQMIAIGWEEMHPLSLTSIMTIDVLRSSFNIGV